MLTVHRTFAAPSGFLPRLRRVQEGSVLPIPANKRELFPDEGRSLYVVLDISTISAAPLNAQFMCDHNL